MGTTTTPYATKLSNGTEITAFIATAIAEGFCGYENVSEENQLRAWSYLIGTGTCWSLQGWYGRCASSLIEGKVIDKSGKILIN